MIAENGHSCDCAQQEPYWLGCNGLHDAHFLPAVDYLSTMHLITEGCLISLTRSETFGKNTPS
jgi:hypothetical protein